MSDPINSGQPKSNPMSPSLTALIFSNHLFTPVLIQPIYCLCMKPQTCLFGCFHPKHHLSWTEQQESRKRVMGKRRETTWMPRANSSTRRIYGSLAFHNCRWSKMDVGRIPLDRKSKKCQKSQGGWIVLNPSGDFIFFPLPTINMLFLSN